MPRDIKDFVALVEASYERVTSKNKTTKDRPEEFKRLVSKLLSSNTQSSKEKDQDDKAQLYEEFFAEISNNKSDRNNINDFVEGYRSIRQGFLSPNSRHSNHSNLYDPKADYFSRAIDEFLNDDKDKGVSVDDNDVQNKLKKEKFTKNIIGILLGAVEENIELDQAQVSELLGEKIKAYTIIKPLTNPREDNLTKAFSNLSQARVALDDIIKSDVFKIVKEVKEEEKLTNQVTLGVIGGGLSALATLGCVSALGMGLVVALPVVSVVAVTTVVVAVAKEEDIMNNGVVKEFLKPANDVTRGVVSNFKNLFKTQGETI
jgi:hypothetical protein